MQKKIKKIFLFFLVLKVLFLGMAGFVFFQNYQKFKEAEAVFKKARLLELKISDYKKIKQDETFIEEERLKLKEKFINKENLVGFIKELEGASEESGVALKIIYQDSPEQKKIDKIEENMKNIKKNNTQKYMEDGSLTFVLEVKGEAKNFLDFLIKLENLKTFLEIKKVDFKKEQKEERKGIKGEDEEIIKKEILNGRIFISV